MTLGDGRAEWDDFPNEEMSESGLPKLVYYDKQLQTTYKS